METLEDFSSPPQVDGLLRKAKRGARRSIQIPDADITVN
jgi:hypothetical protein